jgi:hypothetical protein
MPMTRTRRRRDIDRDVDELLEPEKRGPAPPALQLLSLQRTAGNHAVTRMVEDAIRSNTGSAPRQALARRAQEDPQLLDGIRDAAQNRAPAPAMSGVLLDLEAGDPGLTPAGPGILLGDGGAPEVASPGPTAEEADAQIAQVEGPADASAATTAPTTAPDAREATPAPAESATETPAATEAAPEAAPATAAPTTLTISSKTDMHAPDGSPDTRRRVAMGEVVYFDVGGATVDWTATGGWPLKREGRSTFAWELSDPGSATITATDPASGATASIEITAVAPDSLAMVKDTEDAIPAGTSGAGMLLKPRFGPRNVNFGNVEWLEVPGPASGVSGYFAAQAAAGVDLSHHPNPAFVRIGPAVRDHAAASGFPAPFSDGGFHWDIPNRFRRAATGGQGIETVQSVQAFHIDATGKMTVTKQGASVTRSP